jgi:hypothetical protein
LTLTLNTRTFLSGAFALRLSGGALIGILLCSGFFDGGAEDGGELAEVDSQLLL